MMAYLSMNTITLSMFLYVLLCFPTCSVLADNNMDILQTIFSKALSKQMSTYSITDLLGPHSDLSDSMSGYNDTCLQTNNNFSALVQCIDTETKCLSLDKIEQLYTLQGTGAVSPSQISAACPALLFSLISCNKTDRQDGALLHESEAKDLTPDSGASWGYSFLFVTLINLCSLTGALVLPCMKLKSYKIILMFMVALAVGTLAGSGLLFLVPEAFGLVHDGDTGYIWKASTIMGGIYLFYIIEKVMRLINNRRENTQIKKRQDELATKDTITTSFRRIPVDNSLPGRDGIHLPDDLHGFSRLESSNSLAASTPYAQTPNGDYLDDGEVALSAAAGSAQLLSNGNGTANGFHHHHHGHSHGEVAPVAYMIIFGDALHNFIDGLSIGSAFTQSIMTGVSVSVAVMCEELPHELGDFAILLNSGMPFKRAIMYNFLSACTCYLGLIIGILLGENTHSHEWIFAVAGGMFLYISLVDMMPEMNTAAESPEGKQFGVMKSFMLQNLGLIVGYAIMLLMALYGGNISFE